MRKNIFMFIGFWMFLAACNSVKIETKTDKYEVDTKNWEVNVEKSVFSSKDAEVEQSCKIFNERVQQFIDSLQNNLKTEADTFFALYTDKPEERPVFNYQFYVRDTVFMADADRISVRLSVYSFTGGAHGTTDFYAFNYNVKKRIFLNPGQMIDLKKTKEWNELLAKNFKNDQKCFTDKPTLTSGYTAFNISPETVCFTYPQYVLGPYYCGPAEVFIPRSELKGLLLE